MCNFVIFAWNLQVTLLTDFLQVYIYQCRRDWVMTDCISADYKSGRYADWNCQYCHYQCRRQSDPMHSHLISSHMYDMQPVAMRLQLPFTMQCVISTRMTTALWSADLVVPRFITLTNLALVVDSVLSTGICVAASDTHLLFWFYFVTYVVCVYQNHVCH